MSSMLQSALNMIGATASSPLQTTLHLNGAPTSSLIQSTLSMIGIVTAFQLLLAPHLIEALKFGPLRARLECQHPPLSCQLCI